MGMTTFFILLALLILAPQGLSKGSFYGDYDYTDVVYYQEQGIEPPTFLARPQTFRVEVGQSVIIPCDVENPGGRNKLIIKKVPASGGSEKLLSVGSDRVTPDARITVDGSRLTISHTRLRDAGTFICQFDLEPPVQLRHTLDIQYAPSIRALVPREQRVAKGNTVFLECKAQGNPEPVIRWSRKEGDLPSGHRTEQGERLTLEAVDRHMEGTYLCTADNGIGEPAAADMSVTVEYPPEITVENAIVRTGVGDHVELVCVVHGRPPPDVVWTHNGSPLPDTIMDTQLHLPQQTTHTRTSYQAHLSQTHIAHRHILTINPVKEDDIGTYICIANNSRGQKTAPIEVTSELSDIVICLLQSFEQQFLYLLRHLRYNLLLFCILRNKAIVRTGVGDHVELVCVVHGRPPPDVVWTHNGSPLPDTIMDTQLHLPQQTTHTRTSYQAHLSQTHIAHRHILTINPVKEDDIDVGEREFVDAGERKFMDAGEREFVDAGEEFVDAGKKKFMDAGEEFVDACEREFMEAVESEFVDAGENEFVSAGEREFKSASGAV
nr:limbic system-associated membrane protein-like [Cherax quadricarinatus]